MSVPWYCGETRSYTRLEVPSKTPQSTPKHPKKSVSGLAVFCCWPVETGLCCAWSGKKTRILSNTLEKKLARRPVPRLHVPVVVLRVVQPERDRRGRGVPRQRVVEPRNHREPVPPSRRSRFSRRPDEEDRVGRPLITKFQHVLASQNSKPFTLEAGGSQTEFGDPKWCEHACYCNPD